MFEQKFALSLVVFCSHAAISLRFLLFFGNGFFFLMFCTILFLTASIYAKTYRESLDKHKNNFIAAKL